MGAKSNRLRRFLSDHPKCCFCGGHTIATTEDHWPSRAIFDERKWPNGYVFPACQQCNSATAADETLFALICRLAPIKTSDTSQLQTRKLLQALQETAPELYRSLAPRATQVKAFLRKGNATLPPGMTTREVPVLSLAHPEIHTRIKRCAVKLFLGLHYLHTRHILPSAGGIFIKWYTNASSLEEVPVQDLLPNLHGVPLVKWQRQFLNEQFEYRYLAESESGRASAFFVKFHASLCFIAFAFSETAGIEGPPQSTYLRPFSWP